MRGGGYAAGMWQGEGGGYVAGWHREVGGGGDESSCYAGNCNEKSEGGVHRRSHKRFRRG